MVKIDKNAIQMSKEHKYIQKKEIYRKLYDHVSKKINKYAQNNQTFVTYEMPIISSEFPCFDATEASKYIMKKLQKQGIKSEFNKNTIVISWG